MKAIHAEFHRASARGACVRELRDRGYCIGLSDIERLIREHGIRTAQAALQGAAPDSRHALPVGDNMLNRRFSRPAPTTV